MGDRICKNPSSQKYAKSKGTNPNSYGSYQEDMSSLILAQLRNFLEMFKLDVISGFENDDSSSGNEAFSNWEQSFLEWLENTIPDEFNNYKESIKTGPLYARILGISPKDYFMKNKGEKVIEFISRLSSGIASGRLEYEKNSNYSFDSLKDTNISTNGETIRLEREGIFFAGQYFDAFLLIRGIIEKSENNIAIIDRFIDETVLTILTSNLRCNEIRILTGHSSISQVFLVAANAFQKQFGRLTIRTSEDFHDRFVIIDDEDFYHLGASIKDVGHRGFMFSRIEEKSVINSLRMEFSKVWSLSKKIF